MRYVGIDIGKRSQVASLIDENVKVLFKAFSFTNTTDGAISLIEKLSDHIGSESNVEIGMEATGHYITGCPYILFLPQKAISFMC